MSQSFTILIPHSFPASKTELRFLSQLDLTTVINELPSAFLIKNPIGIM